MFNSHSLKGRNDKFNETVKRDEFIKNYFIFI